MQSALDAFGRVDILVNNAGILRDKTLRQDDAEGWTRSSQVHLKGAYCVTRPAFEPCGSRAGRIVNTSSASGLFGNFGQTNYGAAKMGIAGSPGSWPEGAKHNMLGQHHRAGRPDPDDRRPPWPDGGPLDPDAVSPVVVFLASEQCSVSGEILSRGRGPVSRVVIAEPRATTPRRSLRRHVRDNWDTIASMSDLVVPTNAMQDMRLLLDVRRLAARCGDPVRDVRQASSCAAIGLPTE